MSNSSVNANPEVQMIWRITDLIVEVLKARGPLTTEALLHFVTKAYEKKYSSSPKDYRIKDYYSTAIVSAAGHKIIPPYSRKIQPQDKYDSYVRLTSAPDEPARVPCPEDFIAAYYTLLEKYEAVTAGEAEGVPESILDDIYGTHT